MNRGRISIRSLFAVAFLSLVCEFAPAASRHLRLADATAATLVTIDVSKALNPNVPGASTTDKRVNLAVRSIGARQGAASNGTKTTKRPSSFVWPGTGNNVTVTYHGGAVMSSPISVQFFFYGNWSTAGIFLIQNFILSLSNTSADLSAYNKQSVRKWWNITSRYGVSQKVTLGLGLRTTGRYSPYLNDGMGTAIDDIQYWLKTALNLKLLSPDPSSIILFLTSADVSTTNFCKSPGYCGFHSTFTYNSMTLKYAVVGDPSQQCRSTSCMSTDSFLPTYKATANGQLGPDNMIQVIGHELAETATDPLQTAWYTDTVPTKYEIADLCQGTFADSKYSLFSFPSPGGGWYVANTGGINGLRFLVQTLGDAATSSCILQGV